MPLVTWDYLAMLKVMHEYFIIVDVLSERAEYARAHEYDCTTFLGNVLLKDLTEFRHRTQATLPIDNMLSAALWTSTPLNRWRNTAGCSLRQLSHNTE